MRNHCDLGWLAERHTILTAQKRQVACYGRRAAKNAVRKGKSDAIKTKINARYGKLVLQAAKSGGPSPETNATLAQVMEQAKRANVPKDIIQRNIKRSQDKDASTLSEEIVEVYGPGGTGFIMECLTDNRIRASTEIWTIVKKLDGKMAEAGSVLFNFTRRGEVVVTGTTEEAVFEAAMEGGAEDVAPVDSNEDDNVAAYKIITAPEDFMSVKQSVSVMGMNIDEEQSGFAYQPMATVELEDEDQFAANESLYNRCLEVDDVDAIFTTCADIK